MTQRSHALADEIGLPFPPAGNYINAVRTGNLLVLGGQVPIGPLGPVREVDDPDPWTRTHALLGRITHGGGPAEVPN